MATVKSSLAQFHAEALPSDAVEVGRITGAWGVKGWVKVQGFSADADALSATTQWFVLGAERGAKVFDGVLALEVKAIRPHADVWVVQFAQLDDRDVAQALKGARIFVPRKHFPELEEGEFYWVDLIGLQVINCEGVLLGSVRELISNGPQSVLVIEPQPQPEVDDIPGSVMERKKGAGQREILIPFVAAYVDGINLEDRRIQVDWQPDY